MSTTSLLDGVFTPHYYFDNCLGYQTRLDATFGGNVTVGDLSTNYSLTINGIPVSLSADVAAWSTFPAVSDVNLSGYNLTTSGALNISASSLTLNGNPVGGNASNWSTYNAIQAVNLCGQVLYDSSTSVVHVSGDVAVNNLTVVSNVQLAYGNLQLLQGNIQTLSGTCSVQSLFADRLRVTTISPSSAAPDPTRLRQLVWDPSTGVPYYV